MKFKFVMICLTVFATVSSVQANEPHDLIVSVGGGAASVTIVQVSNLDLPDHGKINVRGGRQNKIVYAAPGQKVYVELGGGATRAFVDRRFEDDIRKGTFVIHIGGGGSFYEFF